MKKQKFNEPELIKAGDNRVKLGVSGTPPKVDCRVIAEYGYQQLKKAYDMHNELIEALNFAIKFIDGCPQLNEDQKPQGLDKWTELIKKATE